MANIGSSSGNYETGGPNAQAQFVDLSQPVLAWYDPEQFNGIHPPPGTPQTVVVPSVWPPGYDVSIVGRFNVGTGHLVGATTGTQFGTPAVVAAQPLVGLGSAQSFGVVTITVRITKPTGGVSSAQAFGAVQVRIVQFITITGVTSPQQFGALSVLVGKLVSVEGVPPGGVYITTLAGQWLSGQAICGASAFTQFGRPYVYLRQQYLSLTGIPSPQQFGALAIKAGPVSVTVVGLGSAQSFGKPTVYKVWARPLPPCVELPLVPVSCTDITLAGSVVTVLTPTASACTSLALSASDCTTLDLDPVEVE